MGDPRPWGCTVDEDARAFAPVRPLEGTAPARWRLLFSLPERGRCVAEFTWGLLQRISFPDGPG